MAAADAGCQKQSTINFASTALCGFTLLAAAAAAVMQRPLIALTELKSFNSLTCISF